MSNGVIRLQEYPWGSPLAGMDFGNTNPTYDVAMPTLPALNFSNYTSPSTALASTTPTMTTRAREEQEERARAILGQVAKPSAQELTPEQKLAKINAQKRDDDKKAKDSHVGFWEAAKTGVKGFVNNLNPANWFGDTDKNGQWKFNLKKTVTTIGVTAAAVTVGVLFPPSIPAMAVIFGGMAAVGAAKNIATAASDGITKEQRLKAYEGLGGDIFGIIASAVGFRGGSALSLRANAAKEAEGALAEVEARANAAKAAEASTKEAAAPVAEKPVQTVSNEATVPAVEQHVAPTPTPTPTPTSAPAPAPKVTKTAQATPAKAQKPTAKPETQTNPAVEIDEQAQIAKSIARHERKVKPNTTETPVASNTQQPVQATSVIEKPGFGGEENIPGFFRIPAKAPKTKKQAQAQQPVEAQQSEVARFHNQKDEPSLQELAAAKTETAKPKAEVEAPVAAKTEAAATSVKAEKEAETAIQEVGNEAEIGSIDERIYAQATKVQNFVKAGKSTKEIKVALAELIKLRKRGNKIHGMSAISDATGAKSIIANNLVPKLQQMLNKEDVSEALKTQIGKLIETLGKKKYSVADLEDDIIPVVRELEKDGKYSESKAVMDLVDEANSGSSVMKRTASAVGRRVARAKESLNEAGETPKKFGEAIARVKTAFTSTKKIDRAQVAALAYYGASYPAAGYDLARDNYYESKNAPFKAAKEALLKETADKAKATGVDETKIAEIGNDDKLTLDEKVQKLSAETTKLRKPYVDRYTQLKGDEADLANLSEDDMKKAILAKLAPSIEYLGNHGKLTDNMTHNIFANPSAISSIISADKTLRKEEDDKEKAEQAKRDEAMKAQMAQFQNYNSNPFSSNLRYIS